MRCARAATAGLVNVSRRRAIGHRAHRNKTVKQKRATAIARRDTVTTSAAREVRIYAALLLVETVNPLSGIARAHWGTKSGTGRPTILNKIRDKNCNKTKKYFTALSSFRRMQRWMRVLPSRVACVLNERVGRIDRHFSGSKACWRRGGERTTTCRRRSNHRQRGKWQQEPQFQKPSPNLGSARPRHCYHFGFVRYGQFRSR